MTNEIAAALKDAREALDELQAAIFDLKKAYTVVQEHHGLKPEDSPYIRQSIKAQTRIVDAIKSLAAIESRLTTDAEAIRIPALSDAEVDAELRAEGPDLDQVAQECRDTINKAIGAHGAKQAQLADAKPSIMKIMAEYKSACDRFEYNRSEFGLAQFVVDYVAHPPTAQLAGPGDEERRDILMKWNYLYRQLFGTEPRTVNMDGLNRTADELNRLIRAALQTPAVPRHKAIEARKVLENMTRSFTDEKPWQKTCRLLLEQVIAREQEAVPAGVTVRELCEAVVDYSNRFTMGSSPENADLIVEKHAAAIAFAQDQVGKRG